MTRPACSSVARTVKETTKSSKEEEEDEQRLTSKEIVDVVSGEYFQTPCIVRFHLEPFSEKLGYLAFHELLTVVARESSDSESSNKTLTFFLKSPVRNGDDFDRLVFNEEAKFYREVVPRVYRFFNSEPWSAKCYLVRDDLIVMEDLRARGFKILERLDTSQLRSALSCLARFHASSFLLEESLSTSLADFFPNSFKQKNFVNDDDLAWKWLLTGIEVIEAVASNLHLDSKYASKAYDLMFRKIKKVDSSRRRNVLCHTDLWINNMMFDGNSNCRFIDFQMVAYSSYAIDIVQLLYLNADKFTRDQSEKSFIEHYHSQLEENLRKHNFRGQMISLTEAFQEVEDKRICGLVSAAQYYPLSLMNKSMVEEFTRDPQRTKSYQYTSRKDFVLKAMQLDENYRIKVEDVVKELIEFMQGIELS